MLILDWIMVPIQVIIFLFTVYYFLIGVNGLWRRKEKKILTPQKSFAVIVAAHNESAVIGQLVSMIRKKARALHWNGCLPNCSRWSVSTMP